MSNAMSFTFTKLFSSITESTVWMETSNTRIVWVTMLAMCDRKGRVWASIPGLANRARVPVDDARAAIERFLAPDPDSRTPDNEGRRIEPIDGGWRLLNHEKYREIRDEETAKEAKRNYINERRRKEREAKGVENVERSRTQSNQADADTDAYTARAAAERSAETREADRTMPESLNAPTFRLAWGKWVDYWSQAHGRGRVIPPATADSHLATCLKLGPAAAAVAISNAIAKGFREPAPPFANPQAAAPRPARIVRDIYGNLPPT